MNVLIIDDNVDILNLLELLIGSTGNQVDVANNGKKGLDMIRDNKYDLILLDITMPEFSGFSILENLMESKNLENNKILFFTATSISDKAPASSPPRTNIPINNIGIIFFIFFPCLILKLSLYKCF